MAECGLYDRPDWYDLVYREGTEAEVSLLERLARAHGNGGKDWLEPACGTGRCLRIAARRGFRAAGYDLNPGMLAYARKRSPKADLACADLRSFRRPGAFDFAFCLQSTFRHLLTESDALAHLRGTAASLRADGVYVLGLDLVDYAHAHDDEEVFEARDGRRRARLTMLSLAPVRRRERILSFTAVASPEGQEMLEDDYALRSYDKGELERLVAKSPFRLEAVYDLRGVRRGLSEHTRDAYFVLKKRRRLL